VQTGADKKVSSGVCKNVIECISIDYPPNFFKKTFKNVWKIEIKI